MPLTGNFVHSSNENYEQWLVSIGVPAESAAKYNAAKPKLEVTGIDNGITIKTTAGDKVFSNNINFGQDSEIDIAGLKYTVNAQVTGNGYKGTFTFGGKNGTVSVEDTGNGFVETLEVGSVTAKRTYSKQ